MSDPASMPVVKRKVGALWHPLVSPSMTAARAFHATLPRAADDHLGIELSVQSVQEGAGLGDILVADLDGDCLLLLMRDGQGRSGLCALDPAFLAVIIEAQMTGRTGAAPRRPALARWTGGRRCGLFWCGDADSTRPERLSKAPAKAEVHSAPGVALFRMPPKGWALALPRLRST